MSRAVQDGSGVGPATAADTLRRRFRAHLDRTGLLAEGQHVLVALSGGLDSVSLLHLLRFALPAVRASAAHYDHAMRVRSDADAAWVRGLCTAWCVPLESGRAPRRPAGEADARELRYAFLHDVAERVHADVIATAHHADDQAETVLFRLARGTGMTGLAGIPARRGMVVRPLLPFTRAELRAYARVVGLRWREDPTNVQLRYARNRIRHVVLPALEAARPGAARRIARSAARVAEAEAAWRVIVSEAVHSVMVRRDEQGFTLAREQLRAYHPHIRARVLRHLLGDLGSRPDRSGTRVAVEFINSGGSGSRVELAGGVVLEREFDRLILRRARAPVDADAPLEIRAAERGSGTFRAGGQAHAVHWAPAATPAGPGHAASFDPSALRFPLELRVWRAGDRIRLRYGSKKLKKLFQERRLGRAQRARVPVLSDAAGRVLWVPGLAQSEDARPVAGSAVFEIRVMDGGL